MRFILPIFILLTSWMTSAQITDILDSTAQTVRTVSGTEAAIENVTTSPQNIKAASETGNKRKTADSLKKTARSIDSASAGLGTLTGANIDASGISDTLKEGADILKNQANTESAADATIRSADRLKKAVAEGNLNKSASAIQSIGSNTNRTIRNMNKWTGGSMGTESMKALRTNLNGISTRLRGASQVQRSGQRISKSADRIQNGLKSGNLSQVASGLKSMSSSIKSGQKGMTKATTGSSKTSSTSKSRSSGSSGSAKTSGSSKASNNTGSNSSENSGSNNAEKTQEPSETTANSQKTTTETAPRKLKAAAAPRKLKGMNTKYNTNSKTLDKILQKEQLNAKEAMTGKLGVETKIGENFHK